MTHLAYDAPKKVSAAQVIAAARNALSQARRRAVQRCMVTHKRPIANFYERVQPVAGQDGNPGNAWYTEAPSSALPNSLAGALAPNFSRPGRRVASWGGKQGHLSTKPGRDS